MNETIPAIDPRHSILLVMDYQSGILGDLPGADDLLRRVAEALGMVRRAGMPVGYVRVAFEDAEYDAVPEANKSFAVGAAARRMSNDAPETAVHAAVAPEPGDIVVRKTRVGAFSTTDLAEKLRAGKIDTIVLAGVSTSGVVLSTVRDAADRDYRIYVLEDGCADRDGEVHGLLMRRVFPRQAYVISIADLPGLTGVE